MKELSTEQKAKRYDEAIKVAEPLYKAAEPMSGCNVIIETLFPELKGSEDEMIRESLLEYLHTLPNHYAHSGVCAPEWIAWLEKQGDQKPAELAKGEDYGVDGLYAAIDILQKTLGEVEGYQTDDGILEHKCAISAVKELSKQKPAAWSDEDESWFKELELMALSFSNDDSYRKKFFDWLNSLKDRVHPLPKQEWSEEDEKFVHGIIRGLSAKRDIHGHTTFSSDCIDITETINWLKSLKPQNRWKPTEELLDVFIKNATDFFESNFNPLTDGGVIGAFDDKEKMIDEFKEYMKEEGFNEEWI